MSEMIKLCGLWKSTDKNGETVLGGNLTYGSKVLILKNSFKSKESDPDYNMYIARIEKKVETVKSEDPFKSSTPTAAGRNVAAMTQNDDIPF